MSKNPGFISPAISAILAGLILLASGCGPAPATPASLTSRPPSPSARTLTPTGLPTLTSTPISLPTITIKPGDTYFSIDGIQSFSFGRNIAGYQQQDYETILGWSKTAGSKYVRIQLDNLGGMGFTHAGQIDAAWLSQWDRVFDAAETDGLYALPVFSTWHDWNNGDPDLGYSTWKNNPVNQSNGGFVKSPAELFLKGSATQAMWLDWMRSLVSHWHARRNILAWEVFSEVNLATGPTQTTGLDFVDAAIALIRSTDPGRPVTASLADCPPGGACYWPDFYKQANIDFVEMHPYLPQLDRVLISEVRNTLGKYDRPVLIGESVLSAATPDGDAGKLTVAANASRGIRHAIWASIVSGAMNGRSLWWEDGYGIYFSNLGMPWIRQYQAAELPAAKFVEGLDLSGSRPLISTTSSGIWGAAVGNERYVIGWFRDAACEPPNWNLKPILFGQTITITVPGPATRWHIDFYDTRSGTAIIGSAAIVGKVGSVRITLPDFSDDIAFKMSAQN